LFPSFATSFACVVDTGYKFATGVNDTGGKFAAGINDTGGNLPPVRWQTLSCEYLREFSKKFETTLMVYSRAWGKLIRDTVPLTGRYGP
jgi:hypothetical protein